MNVLEMFYDENDLVTTPSRTAKSISQVAENITVITAEDIKAMNAHSVADVLNTVTGLQLSSGTGPGAYSTLAVQGSEARHVLVMIDGVSQNNIGDGPPDVGALRIQQIERIEIVKGPASSSWGSSLGGVINIITKSPDDSRKFGGQVYLSYGEKNFGDYRTELSGTKGIFGYYISGGGLITDGLHENTPLRSGNIYSKFNLQPSQDTTLTLTVGYETGDRGFGRFSGDYQGMPYTLDSRNEYDYFLSTLSLIHSISDSLSIEAGFRNSMRSIKRFDKLSFTGIEENSIKANEVTFGGSARLIWQQKNNTMVLGSDLDFGKLDSPQIKDGSQRLDKWAFYVNDTIKLGIFSVTPGLRYDYTSTNGDFWSPSLGATCAVTDNTILRGYISRGFSIPYLSATFGTNLGVTANPDLKLEKVWSYSLGFETAALKYFWLKSTYFRHNISDTLTLNSTYDMWINSGKQRREGVEIEAKTSPVYHLALSAGFTYINAKNLDTDEVVKDVPRYTYDVGLHYDNPRYLRANLTGRYIDYNASPENNGKYTTMIWDFNLSKEFRLSQGMTAEAFFTAHNLFNGAQYAMDFYKNPARWFEGGLRFSF
ncbi:MAG: TonB-dependent receptor [Geobacteraceae bacterium]|nr:TonB-dependent receptor [Geobacteraceae bacterium]